MTMPICQISGKRGHETLKYWHRFDNSHKSMVVPSSFTSTAQALASIKISGDELVEWHVDSGATDPGILHTVSQYSCSDSLMVGDGVRLPITHSSSSVVHNITLNDVLVVPHMKKNILSVSKWTSQFPCYFIFLRDSFIIKDITSHEVLAQGHCIDGLYHLTSALQPAL